MDTLTPLGVVSEYSWMMSGSCGGQRLVILKSDKFDIV